MRFASLMPSMVHELGGCFICFNVAIRRLACEILLIM